ncbi:DUF5013 domain-containing protein [Sphingobacterium sp. SRCM116780]|uniref:DUF4998 domain-containing protein n=1 Tax=Sphingobacterium sp. SRCM116780 TaxID=2907623 RepID=UPI001F38FBB5|nr:DUF4998 domain-containing protein [Sphingobacterium sp. SRCM116780]UIR54822.1 DUF5013 domain-containing protein [Sphingobacterium sp. SRCM116780]
MKLYIFLLSLMGFWMLVACSKMDEFTKYTNGEEKVYPAKMDSIKVRSGKYRVQVEGVFRVNSGVSEIRVYWNSKQDSLKFPVKLTNGNDTIRCLIEHLPEGPMNFEVRTVDDEGRLSIPTFVVGSAYGDRYREGLFQRSVLQQNFVAGKQLELVVQDVAANQGVDAMRVIYKNDGGKTVDSLVKTKSLDESIHLPGYLPNSELSYRTIFRPDSNAIDTFMVQPTKLLPKGDITAWYLKNYKNPFTATEYDGNRWGNLDNWITNSSIKNHNGYGGFGSDDGGVVNIEAGWGAPAVINGKIEQKVTFLPGKYRFFCNLSWTNYDQPPAYLVISKTNTNIPDWEQIEQAMAYASVKSDGVYFEIKEKITVNIGMLVNFEPDHYMKINAFQIILQ